MNNQRKRIASIVTAIFLALAVIASFLLSSCVAQPVDPSAVPTDKQTLQTYPESDNTHSWAVGSRVDVDTTVYKVRVRSLGDMVSRVETNARGSSYNGTGSFSMWQDGKGHLPVEVLSLKPAVAGTAAGDTIILKTSDSKPMALPTGAEFEVICNLDTEVLSPVMSGQVLTTEHLTYELDNCRMTTMKFYADGYYDTQNPEGTAGP